jgi:hypothetical protein
MSTKRYASQIGRWTVALATLASFGIPAGAIAQQIAKWTFETSVPTTAGPHAAEEGLGQALGGTGGTYSNPGGNGSAESFSSNGWNIGDFYQFQVSTTGLLDIGISFDQVSSTTGPRDFKLEYSTDGSSFTKFADYFVQSNGDPGWSAMQPVAPAGLDTYAFDLSSISAVENQANLYFRLTNTTTKAATINEVQATGANRIDNVTISHTVNFPAPPTPADPINRDVVFGLANQRSKLTLELVRPATATTGTAQVSPWTRTPQVQSVEFDNKNNVLHNANGNLLGVEFGNTTNGGLIYSMGTQGIQPDPQLIGNTRAAPNNIGHTGGVTLTRLAGLSVSPNNSKIAVTGVDTGAVIVYNYVSGDTMGAGASLSQGQQTTGTQPLTIGSTQGTTWKDNNTVVTMSTTGAISEVNATTLAVTSGGSVTVPSGLTSIFTGLTYNPEVSDYVWAMYSGFTGTAQASTLYILDPANNYSLINEIPMNTVLPDSAREIALDEDGNLFIGVRNSKIVILEDAAADPAMIPDEPATALWYSSTAYAFAGFSGLDVGFQGAETIPGDFDGNGMVDAADYVFWRENFSMDVDAQAKYDAWKGNFGFGGPGASASVGGTGLVPEPTTLLLVVMGLAALAPRRRVARCHG